MNPIDALMRQCQQQEKYIKKLECNVEDHRVALANVKWELREVQRECNEAEAKLELQPCGHPVACIVQGEQVGPGEFVHYCGWCQSLDVARWQAEQAILGSLRVLAKGELDRIEQHGGTMAFARRVLALAEEGLA